MNRLAGVGAPLLLVRALCILIALALIDSSSAASETEVACEQESLALSCDDGVLNILSANYGRTSDGVCGSNSAWSTECVSSNSLIAVQDVCQGKKECAVTVSNSVFGDPCSGTHKYLEVTYECKLETAVACEHEILALSCDVGLLEIVDANYGRTSDGVCGSNSAWSTECVSSNSLSAVQDVCQGKKECAVAVSNSVFGDPCSGTHKYLEVSYACELDAQKQFVHPGLLHSEGDFDRVRAKVSAQEEPWLSGWEVLTANSRSKVTYQAAPVPKLVRGGGSREEPDSDNYSRAFNDASAAYQNAIRWKVSGDTAHADAAVGILNAWVTTCVNITGDSNKALAAGLYGYQFANAGEIMRAYPGWSSSEFAAFQQWLLDVWLPLVDEFLTTHYGRCDSHYWANWDLANLNALVAIGVVTDRADLYNEAVTYLFDGVGNGRLDHTINFELTDTLSQLQESGRDQGHTTLVVGLLATLAQQLWNQGDDIFSYNNNAILKAAEYVSLYNYVMEDDVPFEEYVNCNGETHTEVSPIGRGGHRPVYARIYNHYAFRASPPASADAVQHSLFATALLQPEGGGGNYGPNSGGFDDLGFGTLMYTLEA